MEIGEVKPVYTGKFKERLQKLPLQAILLAILVKLFGEKKEREGKSELCGRSKIDTIWRIANEVSEEEVKEKMEDFRESVGRFLASL